MKAVTVEITSEMVTAIGTGVIAVVTAVGGALWKALRDAEKRTIDKLNECESKHADATVQLMDLSVKVGELRGAGDMAEAVSRSITDMHREMMQEIRKGISDGE